MQVPHLLEIKLDGMPGVHCFALSEAYFLMEYGISYGIAEKDYLENKRITGI